ncbi:GMC oxidoreductase-domain-containing protein [Gymnopilus junonius]|uniref:pyranose dehydrogenase (acceptor) n=1 Tax=Gymnopilus junonius TaxID=109634 RepID=A0A9P5TMS7_GYMJU|nr:GMC oxidoreductase-domain-containing protein [Gymnopilus junonius]
MSEYDRFVDRDMMMRFRGGGVGHKSTRAATDFFKQDRDKLDVKKPSEVEEEEEDDGMDEEDLSDVGEIDEEEWDFGIRGDQSSETDDSEEDEEHLEEPDEQEFGPEGDGMAGTAGSVIAARIAENPAFSVLVIEAGERIIATEIPFAASLSTSAIGNASLIWNYTTVPQIGLNNRVLPYPRGRLFGGSSSVNSLVYSRGSRDDFNRLAAVAGDPGWSWDSILPFMKKAESFTAPVDRHNTTGEINPTVHGFQGPLLTTVAGFPSPLDSRLVNASIASPTQFPFNEDYNSGNPLGMGWIQYTAGGGIRSSSSTAYLQPALKRINLDVLINTQVTKLRNIAETKKMPDLREVEFAQSQKGRGYMSAGSINTPQILLLSGVGNRTTLAGFGICSIVDNPNVGQHLQDHPLIANQWAVNSNSTFDEFTRNASLDQALLTQWLTTRTGLLTDTSGNLFAWLKAPSSVFKKFNVADPSAGPTSPNFELFPSNVFGSFVMPAPATGNYITIVTGVSSPSSRGSVTLTSSDPFIFPNIDTAFLKEPLDAQLMLTAIRSAEDLVNTPPFRNNGFIIQPAFGVLGKARTDEDVIAYARSEVTTYYHPCGTAKLGQSSDTTAVVDSKLLLKGALGVRIVDASVFVSALKFIRPPCVFQR